jgi:hypothetical protein
MSFLEQLGVLFHITVELDDFPLSTITKIFNVLNPSGFITYHQS